MIHAKLLKWGNGEVETPMMTIRKLDHGKAVGDDTDCNRSDGSTEECFPDYSRQGQHFTGITT